MKIYRFEYRTNKALKFNILATTIKDAYLTLKKLGFNKKEVIRTKTLTN